jgi:hypothetical protein
MPKAILVPKEHIHAIFAALDILGKIDTILPRRSASTFRRQVRAFPAE